MAKILFFDPPQRTDIYLKTNVSIGALSYPSLTLATLAGNLARGHDVRIIDLDLVGDFYGYILKEIGTFHPDIVAASALTPTYFVIRNIMRKIKEKYPHIKTIVGGAHVTALPDEAAKDGCFDIIVLGEGDTVIPELLSAHDAKDVAGIIYKDPSSAKFVRTADRKLAEDLNSLPYPSWGLFSLDKYKHSRLSSRRNPVGLMETSRGCAFQCNFCNKLIFGTAHRVKEPGRVVDEMEYMLKCGFKEIHIADDSFTQKIDRAKEVCAEIIRRRLKFPWSLLNGVRADMVDLEFFKLAKRAGCWQVGFGIESGDQDVLNAVNKKIKLPQVEHAVSAAKKAGVDTLGFFILGLSGETEKSMRRTIKFAKRLPLSIAKFDLCIPYPGTPYYNDLKSTGRIKSEDWSKYNVHQLESPLFEHPNLSWTMINSYYKKAFRQFYLRPNYILRRFARSLAMGDLLYDIRYFFKSKW